MSAMMRIRRLETLPDDQQVRDFDELTDPVQEQLINALRNERDDASIDVSVSRELSGIVRFTSYYAIESS